MFNLGPMEMLVIVVVALVVLGPKRLPDAMRQVGKGIGEVRRWTSQVTNEVQSAFVPAAEPAAVRSTEWTPPPPPAEATPFLPSDSAASAESGAT